MNDKPFVLTDDLKKELKSENVVYVDDKYVFFKRDNVSPDKLLIPVDITQRGFNGVTVFMDQLEKEDRLYLIDNLIDNLLDMRKIAENLKEIQSEAKLAGRDLGHINLTRDLKELFNLANNYEFNDYFSKKFTYPKRELRKRLMHIMRKVIDGSYDNKKNLF